VLQTLAPLSKYFFIWKF